MADQRGYFCSILIHVAYIDFIYYTMFTIKDWLTIKQFTIENGNTVIRLCQFIDNWYCRFTSFPLCYFPKIEILNIDEHNVI